MVVVSCTKLLTVVHSGPSQKYRPHFKSLALVELGFLHWLTEAQTFLAFWETTTLSCENNHLLNLMLLFFLFCWYVMLSLGLNRGRDGQNHHMLMILKSKSNHLNKGYLKSKSFGKWWFQNQNHIENQMILKSF